MRSHTMSRYAFHLKRLNHDLHCTRNHDPLHRYIFALISDTSIGDEVYSLLAQSRHSSPTASFSMASQSSAQEANIREATLVCLGYHLRAVSPGRRFSDRSQQICIALDLPRMAVIRTAASSCSKPRMGPQPKSQRSLPSCAPGEQPSGTHCPTT